MNMRCLQMALGAFGALLIVVNAAPAQTWTQTSAPIENWQSVASSADGTKLVAVSGNGQIYTSANGGGWSLNSAPALGWTSVASSADGSHLAAVGEGSGIYVSQDYGVTWIATTAPGNNWQAIASSADGTKLVAVPSRQIGPIYTSADSGATWTAQNSTSNSWAAVASSADGVKLVAAASPVEDNGLSGGGLYTSSDSGVTWKYFPVLNQSRQPNLWDSVASSADGTALVAAVFEGPIYSFFSPSASLNLTASGGNLTLSWLPPAISFRLQQNSNLASTNWTDMTNMPVSNSTNLQNEVTLSPLAAGNMFFRLAH